MHKGSSTLFSLFTCYILRSAREAVGSLYVAEGAVGRFNLTISLSPLLYIRLPLLLTLSISLLLSLLLSLSISLSISPSRSLCYILVGLLPLLVATTWSQTLYFCFFSCGLSSLKHCLDESRCSTISSSISRKRHNTIH